ncbi:hypothetical protein [Ferviditalea candida]|uniref:Uncharacterized protein n=1 Tax=Ferviditalea candida TaxID=3108399 RepID=A0ABU5ZFV1_9BACL|nr:hypothetical protein [Paenibacillaceae bacterium T2]
MVVTINLAAVNINAQNTNTTLSVGENAMAAWMSHNKQNYGNGQYMGNQVTPNNLIVIADNDVVDMPVNDNDNAPVVQNQQF